MNQPTLSNNLSAPGVCTAADGAFAEVIFGQIRLAPLESFKSFMSLSRFVCSAAICLVLGFLLASPDAVFGQTNYYAANGSEYAVVGSLPGDQMFPDVALNTNGGFAVWQDNITDGSGWGISASRLDNTLSLSPTWSQQRVNVQGTNDQENAHVAMLKNGGAVFVWQGGVEGYQHIFARFLTPTNTWLSTTDLSVNAFTNNFQVNPAVAVLNDSNVVVTWSSYNQAGSNSLLDVYAKILSPVGATVKSEFLVNQFTNYNQRSSTVAALKNGGFVMAWVSEQERTAVNSFDETNGTLSTQVINPSVDIYARLFQSNGVAVGNEFLVNSNYSPCANAAVAAASDGSFMVAWSGRDLVNFTNGWDVYERPFSTNGTGGNIALVNTYLNGNQYGPRLSAIGLDYLVVWTSLDQDGSREGVYGQFVHNDGTPIGGEFRVNTTTISQQMQPAVASDGVSQFLAVWTSYTGGPNSFDLYGQRYENVNSILQAMPAPFVYAPFVLSNGVYQPELQVSWAPLNGISVSNYEVYVDEGSTPMAVTTSNVWMMTAANGLAASTTHSFQLDYVKTDGTRSPISASASGTTWSGENWYGIPSEWMTEYYGSDISQWPAVGTALAPGGPTLLQVFVSGGNPLNSSTWLTTQLTSTSQGMFLAWNTQPGLTYQVIMSTNFVTWSNVGAPRFAAGNSDSIYVGGNATGYYRVVLLR